MAARSRSRNHHWDGSGDHGEKDDNLTDETPEPEHTLGPRTLAGTTWMVLSGSIVRVGTFAAQIVLGLILDQGEFGIYAIAASLAALVLAFRDGGVRRFLVQHGPDGYPRLSPLAFWLAGAINLVLGLLLIILAPLFARFYGEAEISGILIVLGLSLPLGTLSSVLITKLHVDMRFTTVARIETSSAILRYSLTIAFALAGQGANSFVLPILFTSVYEGLAGYVTTRDKPWTSWRPFREWVPLIGETKWAMAGNLSDTLAGQTDYIVLGLVAPIRVVGIYFFAYQLSFQAVYFISLNLQKVLTPALAQLRDTERLAHALNRLGQAVGVFGGFVLGLLAVSIHPLEELIWSGRWMESVLPIQILAFALPLQMLEGVSSSALVGRGRFRIWTALLGLRAIGLGAAAYLGSLLFATPTGITAVVAIFLSGNWMMSGWVSLRKLNLSPAQFFMRAGRGLIVTWSLSGLILFSQSRLGTGPVSSLVVSGAVFLIGWWLVTRVLSSSTIEDISSAMPTRGGALLRRVFCLGAAPKQTAS